MIDRIFYLNKLLKNEWNGQIKVITGLRIVGKSVLFFALFKNYLVSEDVSEKNIITVY